MLSPETIIVSTFLMIFMMSTDAFVRTYLKTKSSIITQQESTSVSLSTSSSSNSQTDHKEDCPCSLCSKMQLGKRPRNRKTKHDALCTCSTCLTFPSHTIDCKCPMCNE